MLFKNSDQMLPTTCLSQPHKECLLRRSFMLGLGASIVFTTPAFAVEDRVEALVGNVKLIRKVWAVGEKLVGSYTLHNRGQYQKGIIRTAIYNDDDEIETVDEKLVTLPPFVDYTEHRFSLWARTAGKKRFEVDAAHDSNSFSFYAK